jgi:hypothetical protein
MFPGGRDLVLRSSELATLAALFSFRYYAAWLLCSFGTQLQKKMPAVLSSIPTLLRNPSHHLLTLKCSLHTAYSAMLLENLNLA